MMMLHRQASYQALRKAEEPCMAGMDSPTVCELAPVPWKIAGNVFSNFYEEFVYRGFMLVALA
jgi:hypothetical protein